MSSKSEIDLRSQAGGDFERAKRAGTLGRIWSSLTGQSNALIPFEDLKNTLGIINQHYRGVQPVPLDKIIGSLGRSGDFDRVFMPLQRHSRGKWLSVDSAYLEGVTLPPVSLYKVGEAYFVVDGHHRVSVARQQGQSFIDAEVIEVQSRVPVTADLRLEDLDVLGEYRNFLEQTKLDTLRPDQSIRLTMPGDYVKLLDHIRVHKYYVETERAREITWEEAVAHWYDQVYWPVIESIRRNNLLNDFPGHTESDLYIWILDHAYYLSQTLGQQVAPWEVAKDYARRFSRRWWRICERVRRAVKDWLVPDQLEAGPRAGVWREERVEAHDTPHIFRDILVTVTGAETGWRALTQAAEFARREQSTLHGLHVASSSSDEALVHGRQVLDEFTFRCQSLGLRSTTSLAVGDVAQKIIERARWADMVVINQRREHGQWVEQPLGTIFQTVASQAARPILAVPGTEVKRLRKVLLAYDGSPKAREALFILRHLIECWHVQGIILAVDNGRVDREMLDRAWEYLQGSGATNSETRLEQGPVEDAILRVVAETGVDLVLMGGYGYQPLLKVFLGSTVDKVLRQASFPVLICR